MNKNRYVILNCPTLMGNRICYSKEIRQCADCTDCVMKQIVESCRKAPILDADWILNKIDIQEVE